MKNFSLFNKGKKGQHVWTDGNDEMHISKGVYNTYTNRNLRYSQVAPLDMFTEKKFEIFSNIIKNFNYLIY